MFLCNWVPSNWGMRVTVEKPTGLSAAPLRSDPEVWLVVCSTCLCPTWGPGSSYVIMFAIMSLHHIIHWQVSPKLLLPASVALWNIEVWTRAWMMILKNHSTLFCLFYTSHRNDSGRFQMLGHSRASDRKSDIADPVSHTMCFWRRHV